MIKILVTALINKSYNMFNNVTFSLDSIKFKFYRLIIAYDEDNVTNILNSAPPCLKVIVTIKDVKPRIVEEATNLGLSILRFSEVEAYGAENPAEEEPPGPATIATICFSRLSPIKNSPESRPKGVMLSHEVGALSTSYPLFVTSQA